MAEMRVEHADSLAKINQAEEYKNQAHQGVQKMQDSATAMTSSSWLGNQSQRFGQRMQQHHDDMHAVLTKLTHHIETGKSNINIQVNHDAE
jgi:uncharacterized protein YukE